MKRLAFILIFITLTSANCLAQKNLNALVFKGEKACFKTIQPKSVWFLTGKAENSLFDEMFGDRCKVIKYFVCPDPYFRILENGDTLYPANNGYIDFIYTDSYHDSAYNKLAQPFIKKEQIHTYQGHWQWFKPGKILCLDRSKKTLRIISINSCANSGQFEKIAAHLEQLNVYDKILIVPCGAASNNFKEITKH